MEEAHPEEAPRPREQEGMVTVVLDLGLESIQEAED